MLGRMSFLYSSFYGGELYKCLNKVLFMYLYWLEMLDGISVGVSIFFSALHKYANGYIDYFKYVWMEGYLTHNP